MKKLRNRKRMTGLLAIFFLVFFTGAAFALTQGELDIAGTVNVAPPEELYVVWTNVDDTFANGDTLFTEGTVLSTATIADARGRTSQRINWTVDFTGLGTPNEGGVGPMPLFEFPNLDLPFARIVATARNYAIFPAYISDVVVEWETSQLTLEQLGLIVDIQTYSMGEEFTGVLAPETQRDVAITVYWDPREVDQDSLPELGTYAFWQANFVITMAYERHED